MTIAYLANSFPETVEPYVWEEICELRTQGERVLACSVKRPKRLTNVQAAEETLYVFPLRLTVGLRAAWECGWRCLDLKPFVARAITGPEPLPKRLRALVHTWLGAYLALLLRGQDIRHIHVHHGYFASWVGMVAAKLLNASFSLTLHGSDLLVHGDYLDTKFRGCQFCVTVSEFNRRYIQERHPEIDPGKIVIHHLGIDTNTWQPPPAPTPNSTPLILSVGRLHPIKNHGFLVQACRELKNQSVHFCCAVAGEGEQRKHLERLIHSLELQREITLLGQVSRKHLPYLYSRAGLVVLTSLSEGIPVTLIEAMAMEKLVLAPAITGIPELIADGETGFLYTPGSFDEFVQKLQFLLHAQRSLDSVRRAARNKIECDFNAAVNLRGFAEDFVTRVGTNPSSQNSIGPINPHEDPLLQQI